MNIQVTSSNPVEAIEKSFDGLRNDILKTIKNRIVALKSRHTHKIPAFSEFLIDNSHDYLKWRDVANEISRYWIDHFGDDTIVLGLCTFDLYDEVDELFSRQWSFTPRIKVRRAS